MYFGANNLSEIGVKKGFVSVGEKRKGKSDEKKEEDDEKKMKELKNKERKEAKS